LSLLHSIAEMASHSEASFENRTSQAPRLPLIGHGCLISPQPISKESTVRDDMGSWAMEVRQRYVEWRGRSSELGSDQCVIVKVCQSKNDTHHVCHQCVGVCMHACICI